MAEKADKLISDLDRFVSKIIGGIPYGRLKIWKELLFKPFDTLKKESKNASIMRGAKDIAVVSFFTVAIILLLLAFFAAFLLVLFFIFYAIESKINVFVNDLLIGLPYVILAVVVIIIGGTLFFILRWLANAAFEFVLAKILGGIGDYRSHAYLDALEEAGISCAMFPFIFINFIPFMSAITGPITTIMGLYGMYVRYLIVKEVHKLSTARAVLVVLIPPAFVVGMIVIFYLLLVILASFSK